MKKTILFAAAALLATASSAMVMEMYFSDGSTTKYNVNDINKVSYQGSNQNMVVEHTNGTDTFALATDSVRFLNTEIKTIEGHAYVDLGLSMLWAANNVGAKMDNAMGDKFAWAETTPYESNNFGLNGVELKPSSNYIFNLQRLHKYTKLSGGCVYLIFNTRYNLIDSLTTLLPMDDAAFKNWGNAWSTPTADDWEELINNCDLKYYDNYNGKSGYLATSKIKGYEGNSVFFPVEVGQFVNHKGEQTNYMQSVYWSSTLESTNDMSDKIWAICLSNPDFTGGFSGVEPPFIWNQFNRSSIAFIRPVASRRYVAYSNGLKSARAEKNTCKVIYLDIDSTRILKVEDVTFGSDAKLYEEASDAVTRKNGSNMVFDKWSADLTNIITDIVAYPVLKEDKNHTYYKVRVMDFNNKAIDSTYVVEGGDVDSIFLDTYHQIIAHKGGIIKHNGTDFTNVRANIDIETVRVQLNETAMKGGHYYTDLGLSVNWSSIENVTDHYNNDIHVKWGALNSEDEEMSDAPTTLPAENDAATQKWGEEWRTPTYEEFEELLSNCHIDIVYCYYDKDMNLKHKDAFVLTSKKPGYEDRFILLPVEIIAPDCGINYDLHPFGHYWTATASDKDSAIEFNVDESKIKEFGKDNYGFIHPVTAK